MNEYSKLCALLKVMYQNLWTLHHNLDGDPAWKGNHEWLADWYAKCEDQADHLIEIGLQLGYKEPTITEALLLYPAISTDNRKLPDTQRLAYEYMEQLMAQLDKARADQPADVDNEIQAYQHEWRLEMYKLSHAMGKPAPEEDED